MQITQPKQCRCLVQVVEAFLPSHTFTGITQDAYISRTAETGEQSLFPISGELKSAAEGPVTASTHSITATIRTALSMTMFIGTSPERLYGPLRRALVLIPDGSITTTLSSTLLQRPVGL